MLQLEKNIRNKTWWIAVISAIMLMFKSHNIDLTQYIGTDWQSSLDTLFSLLVLFGVSVNTTALKSDEVVADTTVQAVNTTNTDATVQAVVANSQDSSVDVEALKAQIAALNQTNSDLVNQNATLTQNNNDLTNTNTTLNNQLSAMVNIASNPNAVQV